MEKRYDWSILAQFVRSNDDDDDDDDDDDNMTSYLFIKERDWRNSYAITVSGLNTGAPKISENPLQNHFEKVRNSAKSAHIPILRVEIVGNQDHKREENNGGSL